MQVLKVPDQVALQVERPQVSAQMPEKLNPLDILMVQSNLLKSV
jgi:hypothetical protein